MSLAPHSEALKCTQLRAGAREDGPEATPETEAQRGEPCEAKPRIIPTAIVAPFRIAPMLRVGAASRGGSSEPIPWGADGNNAPSECPHGLNSGAHGCRVGLRPLHGIDHLTSFKGCEGCRYRCYDTSDPRPPKYVRGPFPDEDDSYDGCRCLPYSFCRQHNLLMDRKADQWYETESQRGRKALNHQEAYAPAWHKTYYEKRLTGLVEAVAPWEKSGEELGCRHGAPAREALYRFFAYCILYLPRTLHRQVRHVLQGLCSIDDAAEEGGHLGDDHSRRHEEDEEVGIIYR